LYDIHIEFAIPMKIIRLIKFPIKIDVKQGDVFFAIAFQLCFRVGH